MPNAAALAQLQTTKLHSNSQHSENPQLDRIKDLPLQVEVTPISNFSFYFIYGFIQKPILVSYHLAK